MFQDSLDVFEVVIEVFPTLLRGLNLRGLGIRLASLVLELELPFKFCLAV